MGGMAVGAVCSFAKLGFGAFFAAGDALGRGEQRLGAFLPIGQVATDRFIERERGIEIDELFLFRFGGPAGPDLVDEPFILLAGMTGLHHVADGVLAVALGGLALTAAMFVMAHLAVDGHFELVVPGLGGNLVFGEDHFLGGGENRVALLLPRLLVAAGRFVLAELGVEFEQP